MFAVFIASFLNGIYLQALRNYFNFLYKLPELLGTVNLFLELNDAELSLDSMFILRAKCKISGFTSSIFT
ncbi:hypothetical protein BpHYR1_030562 [Brachionus plicatilis]|uniref:Uncharacterized protein n=1 Tax=Brachionus plicatilis TaxID=10195 RepID=A0A3M7SQW8_BRAPC|nr:hypothetical protein BpHYR1_030562 [Brachionus plicatilis]